MKNPIKRGPCPTFAACRRALSLKQELHLVDFSETPKLPSSPPSRGQTPEPQLQVVISGVLRFKGEYKALQWGHEGPACWTWSFFSPPNNACKVCPDESSRRRKSNRFMWQSPSLFALWKKNKSHCLKCILQCQALHHPCATSTTVITYGENGAQGDQIQFLQKRHLKPLRCLWVSYLVVAASIKGHKPLITQHHFCRCFGYPVASRLPLDDYLYRITESS